MTAPSFCSAGMAPGTVRAGFSIRACMIAVPPRGGWLSLPTHAHRVRSLPDAEGFAGLVCRHGGVEECDKGLEEVLTAEDLHVKSAQALGVDEDVHLGDSPARDREAH